MTVRDDFATALSTVDGVTGSPFKPKGAKTGSAWPRWAGAERDDGVLADTWEVRIMVPDDEIAQEAWVSERLQALCEALTPVAYIEKIEYREGEQNAILQFTVRE